MDDTRAVRLGTCSFAACKWSGYVIRCAFLSKVFEECEATNSNFSGMRGVCRRRGRCNASDMYVLGDHMKIMR